MNADEIAKAHADRDERLRAQKAAALERELANALRTGKGDVDLMVEQIQHYGGTVPSEVGKRQATSARTGVEKRG